MNPYQHLQERFKCPKCKNQTSICRTVSLAKVSEKILGGHSDKYLFISCSLCGYTETYNLKIVVQATEEQPISATVLEPNKS